VTPIKVVSLISMTSPESSIQVSIQHPPSLTASTASKATVEETPVLPSAPLFQTKKVNDIPEAEVAVLPPDWSTGTAQLVTIQMA